MAGAIVTRGFSRRYRWLPAPPRPFHGAPFVAWCSSGGEATMWIANAAVAGLVAWGAQWPVIDLPYPEVPDEALEQSPCRPPATPAPKPAPGKRVASKPRVVVAAIGEAPEKPR